MLGFGNVFNRKPRQFNYKPLYYDPEKEARNQRRRELGLDVKDDENQPRQPGDVIRRQMGTVRESMVADHQKRQQRMIRSVVMIIILLGLAVWLVWSIVK